MKSLLAYLRTPPEDYTAWHARVSAWWRAKPGRAKALDRTCKVLKYACYLLYPALLVMLAWEWVRSGCAGMPRDFLQALAVPALGFVLVSLMRRAINEPRPYEACGIEKLIDKDTQGKSLPSRHSFSIAVIGMCWLRYMPAAGILILLASLVMAWARVLAGVHYPRDVVWRCGCSEGARSREAIHCAASTHTPRMNAHYPTTAKGRLTHFASRPCTVRPSIKGRGYAR